MSLAKLKKAELVALAEANDLSLDPDWTKDEILGELEHAGITADSAATANDNPGVKRETKKERTARLLARNVGDG